MQNVLMIFSQKNAGKNAGRLPCRVLRQSSGQADLGQHVVVEKGVLQLAPAPGLIASVYLRQLVGVQVGRPLVGNRAGSESVFQLTPRKKKFGPKECTLQLIDPGHGDMTGESTI